MDGVLGPSASINKLKIAQMPVCSVTQALTGKCALDIFSTDLFISEIKRSADKLQLDIGSVEEKALPQYLERCFQSTQPKITDAAHQILQLFGERLAVILLCLDEGSLPNRAARSDWSTEHWDYWHYLKHIILVGGLASPPLGNYLKYYMEQVFTASGKVPFSISLGEDSTYAGLRGCAAFLKKSDTSQINLIFDYGQSFIKRSLVKHSINSDEIIILDKTLSEHVEWDISDSAMEEQEAVLLNKHFLSTISRTIDEVEMQYGAVHPHIILSIANYVRDGVIANRGGYGKLRLIAPNYGDYLSGYLKNKYGREFYFTLIHDGTAMAAGYSDSPQSVCISLGTAFGVGFPVLG